MQWAQNGHIIEIVYQFIKFIISSLFVNTGTLVPSFPSHQFNLIKKLNDYIEYWTHDKTNKYPIYPTDRYDNIINQCYSRYVCWAEKKIEPGDLFTLITCGLLLKSGHSLSINKPIKCRWFLWVENYTCYLNPWVIIRFICVILQH